MLQQQSTTDDQEDGCDLADLSTGRPPAETLPWPSTLPSPMMMTEDEDAAEDLNEDDLAALEDAEAPRGAVCAWPRACHVQPSQQADGLAATI